MTQELLADIRRGQAALAAQHARSQVATRPEGVKTIHAEMKVGCASRVTWKRGWMC